MALVTANVEQEYEFVGFTERLSQLKISPRQHLNDVVAYTSGLRMGATDCAQPMIWALQNRIKVDVFCVYTDSETWHGAMHPKVALEIYRQKMGIPAKLAVIGMVANEFSIADPTDAGQMDLIGFDTSAPAVLADFAR